LKLITRLKSSRVRLKHSLVYPLHWPGMELRLHPQSLSKDLHFWEFPRRSPTKVALLGIWEKSACVLPQF